MTSTSFRCIYRDQTNLAGIKMPGKDKFIDLWAQQKEKPY